MRRTVLEVPFSYAVVGFLPRKRIPTRTVLVETVPVAVADLTGEVETLELRTADGAWAAYGYRGRRLMGLGAVDVDGRVASRDDLPPDVETIGLAVGRPRVAEAYERILAVRPALGRLELRDREAADLSEFKSILANDRERRREERAATVATRFALVRGRLVTDLVRPAARWRRYTPLGSAPVVAAKIGGFVPRFDVDSLHLRIDRSLRDVRPGSAALLDEGWRYPEFEAYALGLCAHLRARTAGKEFAGRAALSAATWIALSIRAGAATQEERSRFSDLVRRVLDEAEAHDRSHAGRADMTVLQDDGPGAVDAFREDLSMLADDPSPAPGATRR